MGEARYFRYGVTFARSAVPVRLAGWPAGVLGREVGVKSALRYVTTPVGGTDATSGGGNP